MKLNGVFSDDGSALPLPRLSAEARLLAKADAGEGRGGGASANDTARVDRLSPTRRALTSAIAEAPLRRSLSKDGRLWRPMLPRKRER
jgi:hypothetical protein